MVRIQKVSRGKAGRKASEEVKKQDKAIKDSVGSLVSEVEQKVNK